MAAETAPGRSSPTPPPPPSRGPRTPQATAPAPPPPKSRNGAPKRPAPVACVNPSCPLLQLPGCPGDPRIETEGHSSERFQKRKPKSWHRLSKRGPTRTERYLPVGCALENVASRRAPHWLSAVHAAASLASSTARKDAVAAGARTRTDRESEAVAIASPRREPRSEPAATDSSRVPWTTRSSHCEIAPKDE